jgi:hypothetical protein
MTGGGGASGGGATSPGGRMGGSKAGGGGGSSITTELERKVCQARFAVERDLDGHCTRLILIKRKGYQTSNTDDVT